MEDTRPVFFFDIDNCLYPKSKRIHIHANALMDQYLIKHLELSHEDANKLHKDYTTDYGLAVKGLARHHKIDPMEFNREVDDALPLESILFPDPELRRLLDDMDKTKVKLWLFTNAYVTHGKRVVQLLGVDDLFEGITFCDYNPENMLCKPHHQMFEKAMNQAGSTDPKACYFVDDSALNCRKAEELGWIATHLLEEGEQLPEQKPCTYQIRSLQDLRTLFPEIFKSP